MEPSYIPPNVYQFRVILQGISPLIWRQLCIRSDLYRATCHAALQLIFASSDTRVHSFHIYGKTYGSPQLGGPHVDVDTRHLPLVALRLHRGERFSYVYTFIDHWKCELHLEAMLPWDPQRHYPVLEANGSRHQGTAVARGPICNWSTSTTSLWTLWPSSPPPLNTCWRPTLRHLSARRLGTLRPFEKPSINSTPTPSFNPHIFPVVTSMPSSVRWFNRKEHDHIVYGSRGDHYK
jgi:pRiA4b ORF-3-like protein